MTAILGALKYIPASTARKALEKVNPGFKNYFAKSAAYGLDINRAIDYLSDRFQSDSQKAHKQHLQRGEANHTLRPDELASKAQIDNSEMPFKAAKTAASFIGGGLLGSGSEDQEEQPKKLEKPKSSKQALGQYNEMQKKKKLIDQLQQDFYQRYGQANAPQSSPGAMNQPQQEPLQGSSNIERLIQLLQQRKQGMQ